MRFDGEKTEVKSVGCGSGSGGAAQGGTSASASAAAAPAQPLSPNDNPAYGSPLALRVAAVPGGSGGSDNRGEMGEWIG